MQKQLSVNKLEHQHTVTSQRRSPKLVQTVITIT